MIDVPSSTTVLLIELVAATTSLCIFITVAGWNRWRKRRAVVVALVKKLKTGGAPRLEKLTQILTEPGSLDADAARELAEKILRLETKLYQNLIGGLLDLTGAPLLNLDQHVEALVGEITKTASLSLQTGTTPAQSEPVLASGMDASASINEGFVKLKRDNAELKAAIDALRAELHTLAATGAVSRPITGSPSVAGDTPPADSTPATTNHDTLGVQELDLDFSKVETPQSVLPAQDALSAPINDPPIKAIETTPEELDLQMSTTIVSEKPIDTQSSDASMLDDQIAAMPDDWLNETASESPQSPLADADSIGATTSSAPDSSSIKTVSDPPPKSIPDEAQSLDEVLQAVAPPSSQGPRSASAQPPISVEIDPDAFLDSLLNDAKQTSLNVIASTSPPSGKKPGKSSGEDSSRKAAETTMDKKTANTASNQSKSPSSGKSALEAELEDLLN